MPMMYIETGSGLIHNTGKAIQAFGGAVVRPAARRQRGVIAACSNILRTQSTTPAAQALICRITVSSWTLVIAIIARCEQRENRMLECMRNAAA